jgi:hypothetical protein
MKDEQVFWGQVEKTALCWEWLGPVNTKGYGRWRKKNVHRVAYEQIVGAIPLGLVLDHICRNRKCVRPEHLRAVTNKENVIAGIGPTAINARKTHCYRGHPFNDDNTAHYGSERRCIICIGLQKRRGRARVRHQIEHGGNVVEAARKLLTASTGRTGDFVTIPRWAYEAIREAVERYDENPSPAEAVEKPYQKVCCHGYLVEHCDLCKTTPAAPSDAKARE